MNFYSKPGLTLPLGVVIPTKNSMAYLPHHVEGLGAWLDLAAEVVVVDSHSTDGTVEFLRANLRHPALQFTSHPPGLYASWNHGIAQIRSKYVYIATTGDTITRNGISKLVDAAESLECDVVISKPTFCNKSGRALRDIQWPIDDILGSLGVKQPRKLHKLEAIVFATVHATGAMTGSCASCLFRTETLKRLPFPTGFGTAGDGVWGVRHAAEVIWGVAPERFSTFLLHPSRSSAEDQRAYANAPRVDRVLRWTTRKWLEVGTVTESELARIRWGELLDALARYLEVRSQLNQFRHKPLPWSLRPRAWRARFQREQRFSELHALKHAALQRVRARNPAPAGALQT